jgi:hypothetical protein
MGRVVGVPSLNVCVDLFAGEIYLGRVEVGE